jgi:hypothetical protein
MGSALAVEMSVPHFGQFPDIFTLLVAAFRISEKQA